MATGPAEKRARIDAEKPGLGPVRLDRGYFDKEFISQFRAAFTDPSLCCNTEISPKDADACQGEIAARPFHTGRLHNIFAADFLRQLKRELGDLQWHERSNDLYSFYQTDDLALNSNPHIKALRNYLSGEEFVGFMEQITGVQLTRGYLDLAAQRYKPTNHLLCHDDDVQRGKLTRKIAYIIYLAEEWTDEDGGALGLFAQDAEGHPTSVVARLVPKFNSIGFFLTGHSSYHTVEEVTAGDGRERWSVTGWFYGPADAPEDTQSSPLPPSTVPQPESLLTLDSEASEWINPDYLKPDTQAQIQDAFLEQSSMELRDFLRTDIFAAVQLELDDNLWAGAAERGPAHVCKYLEAQITAQDCPMAFKLLQFLKSAGFAQFLCAVTSLDFGQASQQVRRFDRGHYTLVHDQAQEPTGLDVTLSLSPKQWIDAWGGATHYIADKDELLRISPQANSLSMVMRDDGTLRFVKYLNHTTKESRQEVSMVFIEA
ncbi:putative component of NuA3 histone acetyltransferase complex [Coemansia sp. RSA 2704]|nr:putative component of NuA3 histone acetyltransferase complex [Coemansia sp. RSA 2704]